MEPPISTGWPAGRSAGGSSGWPGPKARVAPLRCTYSSRRWPSTRCSSTLQVLCDTSYSSGSRAAGKRGEHHRAPGA